MSPWDLLPFFAAEVEITVTLSSPPQLLIAADPQRVFLAFADTGGSGTCIVSTNPKVSNGSNGFFLPTTGIVPMPYAWYGPLVTKAWYGFSGAPNAPITVLYATMRQWPKEDADYERNEAAIQRAIDAINRQFRHGTSSG